jgi:hypothetical protein
VSDGEEADDADVRVRSDIERYGWHVALVPPEHEDDPRSIGWAFTIGLFERFQHPELAVFGMDLRAMHQLLNRAGVAIRKGWRLEAGPPYSGLLEAYDCSFRSVLPRWYAPFLGNAQWHYRGDAFPVLQLFWPDAQQRFPWDTGFAPEWRSDQPLLFLEDPEQALSPELRDALARDGAL